MADNKHRASRRPARGRPAPPEPVPGRPEPVVRIGTPDDMLAVVPHLLGFYPADSLVLLGLSVSGPRPRVTVTFRYDLPDPPGPAQASEIAGHAAGVLAGQGIGTVIIVGYGPGRLVTPLADLLRSVLPAGGVTICELLRAESGRYWSYLCTEPACCPADGVPFDPAAHPAGQAMAAAGLAALPSRAALAATLAPRPEEGQPMRAATDRALARAGRLIARATAEGGSPGRMLVEAGRVAVLAAISCYRAGDAITDHDQLAWLSVVLADLRVRDDAWARMDPGFTAEHQRLWADLVRQARPEHVPAAASLLAFTAWQAGMGALALVAVERALAADPGYSMARLIADAVQAGMPPAAARLPMTPEEVAASYAGTLRGPGPEPDAAARPAPETTKGASRRPSG